MVYGGFPVARDFRVLPQICTPLQSAQKDRRSRAAGTASWQAARRHASEHVAPVLHARQHARTPITSLVSLIPFNCTQTSERLEHNWFRPDHPKRVFDLAEISCGSGRLTHAIDQAHLHCICVTAQSCPIFSPISCITFLLLPGCFCGCMDP